MYFWIHSNARRSVVYAQQTDAQEDQMLTVVQSNVSDTSVLNLLASQKAISYGLVSKGQLTVM